MIIQMFELPERWHTHYEEYQGRQTTIAHYVFEDKTFYRCCCHKIGMRKVTSQRVAATMVTTGATMVRISKIMALLAQE